MIAALWECRYILLTVALILAALAWGDRKAQR